MEGSEEPMGWAEGGQNLPLSGWKSSITSSERYWTRRDVRRESGL